MSPGYWLLLGAMAVTDLRERHVQSGDALLIPNGTAIVIASPDHPVRPGHGSRAWQSRRFLCRSALGGSLGTVNASRFAAMAARHAKGLPMTCPYRLSKPQRLYLSLAASSGAPFLL